MPELNALPAIAAADITNDDLILMYDKGAATNPSRKATRADFLKDVPRENGNHNFGAVEVTNLIATAATIVTLGVTTSITFNAGATLQAIYAATGSIVIPTLSAGSASTATIAVAGVLASDHTHASFTTALADGLTYQCWVSAADTVSIRFLNVTTGSISTDTHTAIISVSRFDFS